MEVHQTNRRNRMHIFCIFVKHKAADTSFNTKKLIFPSSQLFEVFFPPSMYKPKSHYFKDYLYTDTPRGILHHSHEQDSCSQ